MYSSGCDIEESFLVALACFKEHGSIFKLQSIIEQNEENISVWDFHSDELITLLLTILTVEDDPRVRFLLCRGHVI